MFMCSVLDGWLKVIVLCVLLSVVWLISVLGIVVVVLMVIVVVFIIVWCSLFIDSVCVCRLMLLVVICLLLEDM